MLIRIRGYHDGIKAYLENGQRKDREFDRDEMDERVILAGDLELTNEIIQSIDTDAERYLNITLSFKEDEVSREVLADVVREFELFAFAAYRTDEYNIYAEAHVPRVKSYMNRRSGEFVERKVHLHVVIPKLNLLSGRRLDPFGMIDRQQRFLEAIQEHINAKFGLASPKDNRRMQFTDASEIISRYKGDIFRPQNRELKSTILEAIIAGDVTSYEDFRALLVEFGETRTRNAGRGDAYENVKPPGADKGVNLNDFVFSREFIELDADGKREALERNVHAEYVRLGVPRATPQVYRDALANWYDTRAREIKYLNSGSRFYKTYQAASPDEQRRILEQRERRFYDAIGGLHEHEWRIDGRAGPSDWRDWRQQQRWQEQEVARPGGGGRWRRGADRDFDTHFDRSCPPARSSHGVRGVPGSGMDGDPARRQMLLPVDALLELGNQQADRIDSLRWIGDRERAAREQPKLSFRRGEGGERESDAVFDSSALFPGNPLSDPAPGGVSLLDVITARMYASWDTADHAARARLAATAAEKFLRADGLFGEGQPPPALFDLDSAFEGRQLSLGFDARGQIRNLADVQSINAIRSFPFAHAVSASSDGGVAPFNGRARAITGREADCVRDQLARDLSELRAVRRAREHEEFAKIRVGLDATRLLAALAHSHGLIVEKYSICKGADGGDRIRAGTRHLNVSDFLTKEMSLSWEEAARLLRETYRAQVEFSPEHAFRRSPEGDLWGEFLQWRTVYRDGLRQAWDEQMLHEKQRQGVIKGAFYGRRGAFADRIDLSALERRKQMSAARVARLEAEAVLRERIRMERAALRGAARRPITEQYRHFLQERAQFGDERALRELRRMQQIRLLPQRRDDDRVVTFAPPGQGALLSQEHNEIFFRGPLITYEVRANGEVDYRKDGQAFLVDEGRTLRLLDGERAAIEIALRFAQQKFGSVLSLSGSAAFQAASARVAAELRMRVVFEQPETERMRQILLEELDAEGRERRAAQRVLDTLEREQLHDAVCNPPPVGAEKPLGYDGDPTPPTTLDAADAEPDHDC